MWSNYLAFPEPEKPEKSGELISHALAAWPLSWELKYCTPCEASMSPPVPFMEDHPCSLLTVEQGLKHVCWSDPRMKPVLPCID